MSASFVPPDDVLLLLGRQRVPGCHVVQVLLHDHIAAAGERRILGADQRRAGGGRTDRVLGPVHESEQVPLVEIAEPVHLVHHGHRVRQPGHDLGGQLEAQVHPGGPDVEQHVARGGDGVPRAGLDLLERVQPGRPWPGPGRPWPGPGQPGPRPGTEAGHTAQPPGQVAEPDRPEQAGQVPAQRTHRVRAALIGVHHRNQEDRRTGQRGDHGLRLGAGGVGIGRHASILHQPPPPSRADPLMRQTSRGHRGGTCRAAPWCAGCPLARGAARDRGCWPTARAAPRISRPT